MPLHPRLAQLMTDVHADLSARGELPSLESLQTHYATFRRRFGPDVLKKLSGQPLLDLVKNNGPDGLVYWLEFKDDDEFPAHFGSISGGSALKYGVYRRRETGAWTTGSSHAQREISTAEALAIATTHRDQLLAASELLDSLQSDLGDEAYAKLQADLVRVAPDVQDSSWGHKYLSLLHPNKLDDFHAASYQRFYLIKTLQRPPVEEGRYGNAFRFVQLGRELNWPLNHVTTVMYRLHGSPHRYWRIGTRSGSTNESFWDMMRTRSAVAIGWPALGDLSASIQDDTFKDGLKRQLAEKYPKDPSAMGRAAQQITHFCQTIEARDYVVASDGMEVLGIGRVTGEYQFELGQEFPHRRSVDWLSLDKWKLPTPEGLRTTIHQIRKHPDNLVAIERQVLEASPITSARRTTSTTTLPARTGHSEWTENGVIGRVQEVLARKSQLILYGPPGTGKTHWAEHAAHELAALWNFGIRVEALTPSDRARISGHTGDSFVRVCSFHPGYGYEDFIEGYRPFLSGQSLHFALQDGLFKKLCSAARDDPDHRYYLIIDEINRGDIPRIFGELLTLLEKPKRGTAVTLPLSGASFSVPANLFLIGTMNTADRSIALLDAALRRRFGFVELMPDSEVLGKTVIAGVAIGPWLDALNRLIVQHVGRDGRHLQVGHSYLLNGSRPIQELRQLARVIHEDLLPLLEEYCYDDWTKLEQILGKRFVDGTTGRFRSEIFQEGRQDELVQAILAIAPEVSASSIAVTAANAEPGMPDREDDDENDEGQGA